MMTLYEIKVRCGKEFDVVSPQVTLNLCLKIEELQAQLTECETKLEAQLEALRSIKPITDRQY